MSDFSVEPGNGHRNSVLDQIIETIKNLSESKQKQLLELIHKWIKDGREHDRIDYDAEIIFSDNSRLAKGSITNISASGLYLQPSNSFAIGQLVTLSFEHPSTKMPLKLNGKIVRNDQEEIAVKFEQTLDNIF